MAAISSFLKLREKCNYNKRADSHKEHFGENHIKSNNKLPFTTICSNIDNIFCFTVIMTT